MSLFLFYAVLPSYSCSTLLISVGDTGTKHIKNMSLASIFFAAEFLFVIQSSTTSYGSVWRPFVVFLAVVVVVVVGTPAIVLRQYADGIARLLHVAG